MNRWLTCLTIIVAPVVAQAAVHVDVTSNGSPAAGLTSYTVWLNADTLADSVAAFDGGFTGPMNQVFELGVVATPTLTRAVAPMVNEDEDTHFLFQLTNLVVVNTPKEDGPGTGSYLMGDDGAGGVDNAVFGIKPAFITQNLALAQIVIPDSAVDLVYLTAEVSDGIGNRTAFTNVPIPEPATLSLLAVGVVALCRKKTLKRG